VTDNLLALDFAEITPEQMRNACLRLAGKALDATDGDWAAAADALYPVLEAVGAIPYEADRPRTWLGRPQQDRKPA